MSQLPQADRAVPYSAEVRAVFKSLRTSCAAVLRACFVNFGKKSVFIILSSNSSFLASGTAFIPKPQERQAAEEGGTPPARVEQRGLVPVSRLPAKIGGLEEVRRRSSCVVNAYQWAVVHALPHDARGLVA